MLIAIDGCFLPSGSKPEDGLEDRLVEGGEVAGAEEKDSQDKEGSDLLEAVEGVVVTGRQESVEDL